MAIFGDEIDYGCAGITYEDKNSIEFISIVFYRHYKTRDPLNIAINRFENLKTLIIGQYYNIEGQAIEFPSLQTLYLSEYSANVAINWSCPKLQNLNIDQYDGNVQKFIARHNATICLLGFDCISGGKDIFRWDDMPNLRYLLLNYINSDLIDILPVPSSICSWNHLILRYSIGFGIFEEQTIRFLDKFKKQVRNVEIYRVFNGNDRILDLDRLHEYSNRNNITLEYSKREYHQLRYI
jgi:hypothetical protein